MAGESRTINAISVPIKSDMAPFSKGLGSAKKEAEKFSRDTTRSFSLMGHGIRDSSLKATKQLEELGKTNVGMLTKGMAGLAVSAAASAAAIATIGFKHIQDLGKDATTLGTSAESLSKLRSVAKATGTDVNDLSEFIKGLTSDIHDSIGKTTASGDAMKALGTSAEELSKMTPDEQIAKLNKGFAALPDEAARAKVAMQLAGQNGVKMFRMLSMSSDDFKKTFDSAPIVTEEDVSEVRKLQIAIDKMAESFQGIANLLTTTLVPKITELADMATAFGKNLAPMFGVKLPTSKSAAPVATPASSKAAPTPAVAKNQAMAAAAQQAQSAREAEAAKARGRVADLQKRFDKESEGLRLRPGHLIGKPGTNTGYGFQQSNQKALDKHAQTGQELNAAKAAQQRLTDGAKTQAEAMAEATRANMKLVESTKALSQEYRQTIEESGKDEIHRRVDQLKGLDPQTRKQLIQQGYQAREASKTSSLRDELQESTKLPIQKLQEDLARISRMAALGPENGGLTHAQAIRAAAQKTQEAGVAGNGVQFAGALQANSAEGRSYLLSQTIGKPEAALEVARQGVAATMQGNGFLARIAAGMDQRARADAGMDF